MMFSKIIKEVKIKNKNIIVIVIDVWDLLFKIETCKVI